MKWSILSCLTGVSVVLGGAYTGNDNAELGGFVIIAAGIVCRAIEYHGEDR